MTIIKRRIRAILGAFVALFFIAGLTGCTTSAPPSGQDSESKIRDDNYDSVSKNQPAHTMPYSSTRDTINFWIDIWKDPNAISYSYLVSNGKPYAYVVLKGLPVSYCTSLTPNYKLHKPEITGDNTVVLVLPAPSIDSVYYSGGDCTRYYGQDATSGVYVEFTAGADTTLVTRNQPLPLNQYADALPLGDTTGEQADSLADGTLLPIPAPSPATP